MDKQLIAERFAKARDTYIHEARVQQQVVEKMIRLLPDEDFHHIVEFGCGTGYYSKLLLQQVAPKTLLLNDICPEMEECLENLLKQEAVSFISGDAETLDFPREQDLITSCSTLQWFCNPKQFFARCHSFLKDDGYVAFSTFGCQNMKEITALTGHGLDYLSLRELEELLSTHFQIVYSEEEVVSLSFPTPLDALQHLKQTGVTGTEKKVWTKGRLLSFCNDYILQFTQEDGTVGLTYHPIYIIAKKKNIS